jgi:hypothetical protein
VRLSPGAANGGYRLAAGGGANARQLKFGSTGRQMGQGFILQIQQLPRLGHVGNFKNKLVAGVGFEVKILVSLAGQWVSRGLKAIMVTGQANDFLDRKVWDLIFYLQKSFTPLKIEIGD